MNDIFHLSFYHNPPGCRGGDVPHVHSHHELLYCTSGEGGQMADGRQLPLQPGDLFFYPAGMRHCSVLRPGREFECFVLGFQDRIFTPALAGDKESLDVVDKMGRFHGKVPLSHAGGESARQILAELLDEFHRKAPAYHAVLKVMTMRLLITVARDEEFHRQGLRICPPPSHDDMIQEVLHYLNAFYMDAITVDSVLEFCPMSRSHFHAVFKRATGMTLVEYLTTVRLQKAKEMLVDSDESVASIASHTGFKTSSYFGQLFRLATGVSPGEYRQRRAPPRKEFKNRNGR